MTGQRVRLGSLFDRKSPGDMAKRPCRLACIRGQLAGHVFAVSSCQSALGDGELHPSKNAVGRMTGQRVRLGSLFDRKFPGDMAKRPCRFACTRGELAGHAFAVFPCQSALGDGELHPSKNSAGRMAGQRVRLGCLFDRKSPGGMAKRPCRLACTRGELAGHAFAVSPCQSALGEGGGGRGGGNRLPREARGWRYAGAEVLCWEAEAVGVTHLAPPPVRKTSPSAASCQLPAAYRLPGGRVVRLRRRSAKVVLR